VKKPQDFKRLSDSRGETSVNAFALTVGISGIENPWLIFHNSIFLSHPDVFSLGILRVISVKTIYCQLKWQHVSTQSHHQANY
jgi:hypothetical protein